MNLMDDTQQPGLQYHVVTAQLASCAIRFLDGEGKSTDNGCMNDSDTVQAAYCS